MRENYTLKRLYSDASLTQGTIVSLPKEQVHYLSTVLRMDVGNELRLFNGRDGEWLGKLTSISKKHANAQMMQCLRAPVNMPDIRLAFAPIRRHRTAFIFEKATELGVAGFEPIITARTQFPKLNLEKAKAQIIEAAEQTERLDIPALSKPISLMGWLGQQSARCILFANEGGDAKDALSVVKNAPTPATLLIGPEGGFTDEERHILCDHEAVMAVSLGPRILRADTAALSLLTLWQSVQGDWI